MSTEKNKTKTWKTVGEAVTYDEAAEQKEKLLKESPDAVVKIRRGRDSFRLKLWSPEVEKPPKKKKTKKKNK